MKMYSSGIPVKMTRRNPVTNGIVFMLSPFPKLSQFNENDRR